MSIYTTDPAKRGKFIASLRALADYLSASPAVPVPEYSTPIALCADRTENGGRAQVDTIAQLLDVIVTDDTATGGHYYARRTFGDLVFEIRSIPEAYIAQYDADMTYRGSVTPDAA
jgi:hypothetical protein